MKKLASLCLLSLLGFSCGTKEKEVETKENSDIEYADDNNSLLWEITGNGLTKPSYLFGTIHIIGADDFFLSDVTKDLLSKADVFITEVEINNLAGMNPMDMMIPGDSSLSDFMTDEQYKKVKSFYKEELNMDEAIFELTLSRMLPIMIQQQITVAAFGDQTKSYEMELIKLAKKNKIENKGLESLGFQVGVFKSIPLDEQVTMLLRSVDSLDQSLEELNEMISLYKKQDINGLAKLINESESSKELLNNKDEFLTDRNARWIPKIDSMVQDQSCFIAVGAAHLPEKEGVIELLKAKGYELKPVANKE